VREGWSAKLSFLAVLCLAAALRFWGLRWGLPNSLHSYSYHPDEFLLLGAAGSVLASGLPRFYNYPSLYIYLVAIAVAFASTYGMAHGLADSYLCARVVTALMGVAAVWLVYRSGRRLWGPAEALVAALILCIAPLHVQHSHFATVDVPSTLFVAACLGFGGLVLTRGSWRDYILCGAMAGLAAGTKYNVGLVVFSLIAAHLLRGWRVNASPEHPEPVASPRHPEPVASPEHPEPVEGRASVLKLLVALGCALAAFVISTPGSIAQWPNFVYGLTYEMRHAAQGHGLVFAGTGNGFVYTFTSSLWYGLGPALAILFVAAAVYSLIRLDRRALVILAFALPYYALISLSQVRFARYALPLFPAAALLIGWMACDLWSRFPKRVKWAWAGLCAVILCGTVLYTVALDRLFVQTPPQDRAARWMFANIPKGSQIDLVDVPWFYSPPYSKQTGLGTLEQRLEAMASGPYGLYILNTPAASVREPTEPGRWAALSDYEVVDALRVQRAKLSPEEAEAADGILWDLERLKRDYVRRKTFASSLSALGISFGSTQSLPHDMRYPAPTIWVYMANPHVNYERMP
jgi:4-amino-4-deoxy-L-arabinose transferase-like glycosyltransferase